MNLSEVKIVVSTNRLLPDKPRQDGYCMEIFVLSGI